MDIGVYGDDDMPSGTESRVPQDSDEDDELLREAAYERESAAEAAEAGRVISTTGKAPTLRIRPFYGGRPMYEYEEWRREVEAIAIASKMPKEEMGV